MLPGAPAFAQLAGPAEVADGDTLSVAGLRVRLHGIDAPEYRQTCERDGASWACGEESARQLRALVEGGSVRCRTRGSDNYGRMLGVCEANGIELNRAMVANGWAIALREYSQDYVADEVRAKTARLGIWSSSFQLPQDYRHASEARAEAAARPAPQRIVSPRASVPGPMGRCAIKGNRNRRGQWIYHLPGMPYYEATRAEEIFCTEAEAQAAGYRRAIVK
ncbi:thermonuclease family protein [Tsuneonella rigui]|uniref:thermonuclease family protein n=1 Tax=Tsuneonella rigui TaxID=1708790 RepID=UPI001F494812|nr:thermonuclease family protein [Tsuneonella rigui]